MVLINKNAIKVQTFNKIDDSVMNSVEYLAVCYEIGKITKINY